MGLKLKLSAAAMFVAAVTFAQDPYEGLRESWLKKAEDAKPALNYTEALPVATVRPLKNPSE